MHSEENFNGQAKVLITHIVYRRTTPEAYQILYTPDA